MEEALPISSPVRPGHAHLNDASTTPHQPPSLAASSSSPTLSKQRRKILKTSSSSNGFVSIQPSGLVFTPVHTEASVAGASTSSSANPRFLARKSASSPTLYDIQQSPPPYSPPEVDLQYPATMPPTAYQEGFGQIPSSSTSNSSHSWFPSRSRPHSQSHSQLPSPRISDSEDEGDAVEEGSDNDMIYTSRSSSLHPSWRQTAMPRHASGSSQSLRSRLFALAAGGGSNNGATGRDRGVDRDRGGREDKVICTTPGVGCAGETETETDEPSRHLPTARIIHNKTPVVPPNTFQERLTPLLFEFSRLLSIVPALVGTVYNMYHLLYPPTGNEWDGRRAPSDRLDFFVAALWSILTGFQCLCLTTGLLTRWRLYYQPLSTLVRLLALQGICWPATQLTLTVLEHAKRPALTWAVIGTTTCCSRSIQIWVTSNLWWEKRNSMTAGVEHETSSNDVLKPGQGNGSGTSSGLSSHFHQLSHLAAGGSATPPVPSTVSAAASEENRRGYWKRFGGGKWGGRRWDWKEVGLKCVLPAGVLYFVMALVSEVRREFLDVAIPGGGC